MFTGIIRHVGKVEAVRTSPTGRRLRIALGPLAEGLGVGDSVAVNGACLTVATIDGPAAEFDVVAETLDRTTLGMLRAGSKVNLERSLRVGDGLDGHLVQGHVDGVAELAAVDRGGQWLCRFTAPVALTDQMVPKGSVAIDGVSLTLADVADGTFSVALIPTTLAETTLAELPAGGKVNIETDLIGKYVRRHLRRGAGSGDSGDQDEGGLSMDKLRDSGFL